MIEARSVPPRAWTAQSPRRDHHGPAFPDGLLLSTQSDGDVTRLLNRIQSGDPAAAGQLLPLVYEELYRLASGQMRAQGNEHTLQATALLNEAYMRMFGSAPTSLRDSEHFFALAARAMRSVLVDHARAKNSLRRKANGTRVPLDELTKSFEDRSIDLLALDAALEQFAQLDPDLLRVVELHFFAGLPASEIAVMRGVSTRTIERDLITGLAWLRRKMQ
jgi:RNA polymerase sigma factor (TIGR02999 family)